MYTCMYLYTHTHIYTSHVYIYIYVDIYIPYVSHYSGTTCRCIVV